MSNTQPTQIDGAPYIPMLLMPEDKARIYRAAPELLQAAKDFVYNAKHLKVAGYGDCEVQLDASFKELELAIAKAEGRE